MDDDTDIREAEERRTAPVDAPPSPSRARRTGDVIAGKFRLGAELGRGGMGVVFEATHLGLDDRVAIKLLAGLSGEAAGRMLKEARLAAGVKNEHVVRVLDVGTDEGVPYVVMERLEGKSLAEHLKERGRLSPGEAVDLVKQACKGLRTAHAKGIVHRDLKPSNLFLEATTGRLVVLDFGVAKESAPPPDAAADETSASALLGSPAYMAPEQVRAARSVDARADVWSLGVTLFELLAGRAPFRGETTQALLAAVVADPAPDLRTIAPDVPDGVARAVARCLAKDPTARFADATELAEALAARHDRAPRSTWLALGAAGLVATVVGGFALRTRETPRVDGASIASAPDAPVPRPPPVASPTASVEASPAPEPPAASASARRASPSAAPRRPSPAPSASGSRFDVPGLSETQK